MIRVASDDQSGVWWSQRCLIKAVSDDQSSVRWQSGVWWLVLCLMIRVVVSDDQSCVWWSERRLMIMQCLMLRVVVSDAQCGVWRSKLCLMVRVVSDDKAVSDDQSGGVWCSVWCLMIKVVSGGQSGVWWSECNLCQTQGQGVCGLHIQNRVWDFEVYTFKMPDQGVCGLHIQNIGFQALGLPTSSCCTKPVIHQFLFAKPHCDCWVKDQALIHTHTYLLNRFCWKQTSTHKYLEIPVGCAITHQMEVAHETAWEGQANGKNKLCGDYNQGQEWKLILH